MAYRPVERGSRSRRRVALSFDDGPGDATPSVLDALGALRLPATFFVIGQQVPERAALLRRMVQDGHEVGVHAWEHPDLSAEPDRAPGELDRCVAAVRDAAGTAPRLFRPPLGRWTPELLQIARLAEAGITVAEDIAEIPEILRSKMGSPAEVTR